MGSLPVPPAPVPPARVPPAPVPTPAEGGGALSPAPHRDGTAALLGAIRAGRPAGGAEGGGTGPDSRHRALPVAVVLVLAGVLLAAALGSTRRDAPQEARQRVALRAQIAASTREVAGLAVARARLEAQVRAAGTTAGRNAALRRQSAATVRRLSPVAGTQAVRGPGLTVRLDDPPSGQSHRITDADLQQVANQLWAAGAEAVSVNGVRLTARTAIRSAGEAILVGLRPQSPPYTTSAIGPPDRLSAGFAASPLAARLRSAAAVFGTGLSVRRADALLLPAATLPPSSRPPGARR